MTVTCLCVFCGCAQLAQHKLPVSAQLATPGSIANTALLGLQCQPAKDAYALERTIKDECVVLAKGTYK
jgi:hypothetical protein